MGGATMPEPFRAFWRTWKELHPDWECTTWRDDDLDWLVNRSIFDRSATMSERSDVARFEILARHGGVYVDCDVEPLRPLDDLRSLGAFAGWEKRGRICGAVMGAEKGHPAAVALVKDLKPWVRRHERRTAEIRTGPAYLTQEWKGRADVSILHTQAFYPIHWSEREKLGGPYPDESYAAHHWSHSWKP